MWIDTDGECLLVNTVPTRQRYKSLQRDPRVTVFIPGDHPWEYAEIRGHVVGPEARNHIDALARRYLGADRYPSAVGPEGRIVLKIAADKVNARAGTDQRLVGHADPVTERPGE